MYKCVGDIVGDSVRVAEGVFVIVGVGLEVGEKDAVGD